MSAGGRICRRDGTNTFPTPTCIDSRSVSDGTGEHRTAGPAEVSFAGTFAVGPFGGADPCRAKFQRSSSFSRSRLPVALAFVTVMVSRHRRCGPVLWPCFVVASFELVRSFSMHVFPTRPGLLEARSVSDGIADEAPRRPGGSRIERFCDAGFRWRPFVVVQAAVGSCSSSMFWYRFKSAWRPRSPLGRRPCLPWMPPI